MSLDWSLNCQLCFREALHTWGLEELCLAEYTDGWSWQSMVYPVKKKVFRSGIVWQSRANTTNIYTMDMQVGGFITLTAPISVTPYLQHLGLDRG